MRRLIGMIFEYWNWALTYKTPPCVAPSPPRCCALAIDSVRLRRCWLARSVRTMVAAPRRWRDFSSTTSMRTSAFEVLMGASVKAWLNTNRRPDASASDESPSSLGGSRAGLETCGAGPGWPSYLRSCFGVGSRTWTTRRHLLASTGSRRVPRFSASKMTSDTMPSAKLGSRLEYETPRSSRRTSDLAARRYSPSAILRSARQSSWRDRR
mmetsp:Transcript_25162/g.100150  ORF Transcript_25162/g.100150 Transcript_25162/m.100150 type:complete len:210 (+) Transcript_25162:1780-2409(+)